MKKDKFTSGVVDTLGAIYERGYEKGKKEAATWIPVSDKYEYHIDHTDCLWYENNDSRCPCTCSQYRDGWNDAMNYIFKDGKGYQPYRRDSDG